MRNDLIIRLFLGCICSLFVVCNLAAQAPPIRAAWVTNVASGVLLSRDSIRLAVDLAKKAGLTHLCVVTWNNGYTMYRSKVMQQYFGVTIDPVYGSRDPLQEMVEEAHAQGIKVIAWFEFGFASSYGSYGKHILEKYPAWAAKDAQGNVLMENGFTWMNSFDPVVQKFVTALVTEVVKRYDVDGIQGDDRLPAAPVRGGYDNYTVKKFKEAHHGAAPPTDHTNAAWIDWRAGLMNTYGKQLYKAVKKIKPTLLVAHAPSIYPWSKEHYLQDWPTWLREGYTDVVMPQAYRYNLDAYKKTLDELVMKAGPGNLSKVFPGLLTSLADGYLIKDEFLKACIQYNRSKGIQGESFFYFEGIRRSPAFYTNDYGSIH
jgi:uncharacterized lipoprotein YddW (UPF0748 family)